MTTKEVIGWYKDNLSPVVTSVLEEEKKTNGNLLYTPDWIIAIAFRETWTIAIKHIRNKTPFKNVEIRGDFSMRPGEKEKQYHGFGFWQIDVGSYPDFIKMGLWKSNYHSAKKAISVLEEKRKYLEKKSLVDKLIPDDFNRAITAAYNCGQGNVVKAINSGKGVDFYTHEKNYSEMVWQYRKVYNSI